jgi:hypothetical protein
MEDGETEIRSFKSGEMCLTIVIQRKRPTSPDILSNAKLDTCCATVEAEEFDGEGDRNETTKTEMSDTLGKAPGTTTATLPISHRIHTTHHIYYYTHQ